VRRELSREPHYGLTRFLDEDVEQVEQQRALLSQPMHGGGEALLEQVEARGAEQILARRELRREQRK
jgi:hypothetical protein